MARCERLRGAALRDVLGRAQGVLFDCDGVLWNGERAVPGAPELLERLARAGKAALFVSNNSRRARPELALRFARLGFGGLRAEQLFSSAVCAARLLRQRLPGPPGAPGAVFVLGGEGLRAELRAAGLRLAGDPGDDPSAGDGAAPRVRAVLVGYDEHFSFAKLSEACAHLRDPECLLVATDRDPWHPLSDGSRTPVEGPPFAPASPAGPNSQDDSNEECPGLEVGVTKAPGAWPLRWRRPRDARPWWWASPAPTCSSASQRTSASTPHTHLWWVTAWRPTSCSATAAA
ncbi:pyridoxal phosphate phosphatase isoform X2 [Piliocolobus tephrosceles]|uniref:pyridoxal phosphate phosphatase isoform X2 n=1 Tax=Piliocolobus tephrosceles TaxID=591936 RepID=UPI000C2A4837|nr:pyridoxal phosphate phosphatase isoform X2 [Piliocolobus tephrosceles]